MVAHGVLLSVISKVTDNEALSALEAIRVKMGLGDVIKDLSRDELWEIEVESDSAESARAVVQGLVENTNLFANPNKHRYSVAQAGGAPGAADLADDEVAILVSDRDGGEGGSVLSAVGRMGVDDLSSIRKWTRWRVRLTEPPSPENPELLAVIKRIAVTTSRRDGLLSNPHCQVSRAVLPWGEEKPLET